MIMSKYSGEKLEGGMWKGYAGQGKDGNIPFVQHGSQEILSIIDGTRNKD